mgnify:CR=1 FL=1
MSDLQSQCDAMIGISIDIRGVDYGRIMDWSIVQKDGVDYYVFRTSLGKMVEATSYFEYKKHYIHYPQGSDYAFRMRRAGAKAKNKHQNGGSLFGSCIRNIAHFNVSTSPKHERKIQ